MLSRHDNDFNAHLGNKTGRQKEDTFKHRFSNIEDQRASDVSIIRYFILCSANKIIGKQRIDVSKNQMLTIMAIIIILIIIVIILLLIIIILMIIAMIIKNKKKQ